MKQSWICLTIENASRCKARAQTMLHADCKSACSCTAIVTLQHMDKHYLPLISHFAEQNITGTLLLRDNVIQAPAHVTSVHILLAVREDGGCLFRKRCIGRRT